MELGKFLILRGANLFAERSAAVGFVRLSAEEHAHGSANARALAEDVMRAYPTIRLDVASFAGEDARALGRLLGAVAACLANMPDGNLPPIVPRLEPGNQSLFFGTTFSDERVARRLTLAFEIVAERLSARLSGEERPPAHVEALDAFVKYAERQTIGANSREVIHAAEARGIPWFRFRHGQAVALTQLGWGHRLRRNAASRGPQTSYIGCRLSHSKSATASALARISLPVPRQAVVTATSAAVEAAREIGFPVVVKPLNGSGGRGVSVSLETPEEVTAAAKAAFKLDKSVVVETYIKGDDHRLLVIGGVVCAAAKRLPPAVVGDGRSTMRELLDELNRDPRRGEAMLMHHVHVDDDVNRVIAKQRVSWDDVPEQGKRVLLRGTANMHGGGTAVDVTDVVHPDNRALGARAAHQIGLDIAGIDFITPDITKSWREVGGAICEINDWPSIGVHVAADATTLRDYSGMIIDAMFPPGQDGRIPLIGVVGADADAVASAIGDRLAREDIGVGLVTRNRLSVGGWLLDEPSGPHADRVARCLEDPWCEVLVAAASDPAIVASGLGYDRASVAVLGGPAQPGELDARAVQALAALRVVANGEDASALAICASRPAREVDLVVPGKEHAQARAHVDNGGAVYYAEGDALVRLDASGTKSVAALRGDAPAVALAALHALEEYRAREAEWAAWSPPTYLSRFSRAP